MTWGLLAPEKVESKRRTRTIGVAAAVREFNDLAVPGLGGVWFGKQVMLATLGVQLAEQTAKKQITVANAVEALACGLALQEIKDGGQLQDARLRGSTKLRGKTDFSFKVVSKTGFYVTQPMRMATVQTLPALGLVTSEASRFNAFSIADAGESLIEAAIERKHFKTLSQWVAEVNGVDVQKLRETLSPLTPLPDKAKSILLSQIQQGSPQEDTASKTRRKAALAWVESIRQGAGPYEDWSNKPPELDDAHWNDLQVGALFFATRDAAINVLNAVESHIANLSTERTLCLINPIPPQIVDQIVELRRRAQAYTALGHAQQNAKEFCSECLQNDNAHVLSKLVGRDGRVLQLRNGQAVPGPSFGGKSEAAPTGEPNVAAEIEVTPPTSFWPTGTSHRVKNLFRLNADLHGDLSQWMNSDTADKGDDE
jgi:hypothetical protein